MKLSKRLQQITALVPQGARVADIGSDHAFVPITLAQNKITDFVIASEVAPGPLGISQKNIEAAGVQTQVQTRLGDGLQHIELTDKIDTIIIAGMGGELIQHILMQAEPELLKNCRLILEPNNHEKLVRQWLNQHSFQITNEHILEEEGHFYEIIVAEAVAQAPTLTVSDLIFGPILKVTQNKAFINKWQHRLSVDQKILTQLQKAASPDQQKIATLKTTQTLIERVLTKYDPS